MSTTAPFAELTCVLTGANRGIGLALARALLAQGAHVYAGVRRPDDADQLQAAARGTQGKLTVAALDVQQGDSVQRFVDALPKGAIDLLINNAGVNLDHGAEVQHVCAEAMLESFDCNAVGPLRLTQKLLPQLRQSKRPKVANISSAMGSIGDNAQGGVTAYRASKAALNMVTKNLALAERGVVFLTMHPGWVQTRMGGERAPLAPEESARGLLQQIAAATAAQSGTFVRFDGQLSPW